MRVVTAFDVEAGGQACCGVRREALFREALHFDRREEDLGHGVVVGIAARFRNFEPPVVKLATGPLR